MVVWKLFFACTAALRCANALYPAMRLCMRLMILLAVDPVSAVPF